MKYILHFNDEATPGQIDEYLNTNGCTSLKVFSALAKICLVESDSKPPVTDLIEHVVENADSNIGLMADSHIIPTGDEDQWWKVVSAAADSQIDSDTNTVTLRKKDAYFDAYVVDSGIMHDHPEFVNTNIHNLYSITGDYNDQRGHGTYIAGLLGGETTSLVKTNIINVKIIDADSNITIGGLVEAFDAIQTHSASRPLVPAVVNLSWTIPENEYINFIIQRLISRGVAVFASAGNSAMPMENLTPACIPGVITVGAFDKMLAPASFSNYTTYDSENSGIIDCWAPGVDIMVPTLDGGYGLVQGTSVAAPIAAGAYCYNLQDEDKAIVDAVQTSFMSELPFSDAVITNGVTKFKITYRKDMIDMPHEYADSTNSIVTYLENGVNNATRFWLYYKGDSDTIDFSFRVNADSIVAINVYDHTDVESATITSKPENSEFVLDSGLLVGTLPDLPQGELYKVYEVSTEFVSYDSTVTRMSFTITQITTDQDLLDTVTPDHDDYDIVHITLSTSCGGETSPAGCRFNPCPNAQLCASNGAPVKGIYPCECE